MGLPAVAYESISKMVVDRDQRQLFLLQQIQTWTGPESKPGSLYHDITKKGPTGTEGECRSVSKTVCAVRQCLIWHLLNDNHITHDLSGAMGLHVTLIKMIHG